MAKIFTILFLILLSIFASLFVFYLHLDNDKDICLDNGTCKEGLMINTQYGFIRINKESCLKYNWFWDDKTKYCTIH